MKITIKTESDPDIVSSPVICGISIDGVMSQNDVRDALSEIDKFAEMFFNKQIHKSGNEPDPHDFCANAATAKTCKATAEQLAQRAKQEVHALKNLDVLDGDETADKKAGRIYDLIDQIVVCGVSEKRYGNSFIPDPNAQHLDLAVVDEIAQLRKENQALKDKAEKQNEILHNTSKSNERLRIINRELRDEADYQTNPLRQEIKHLSDKVKSLKAKIYDIQIKEK